MLHVSCSSRSSSIPNNVIVQFVVHKMNHVSSTVAGTVEQKSCKIFVAFWTARKMSPLILNFKVPPSGNILAWLASAAWLFFDLIPCYAVWYHSQLIHAYCRKFFCNTRRRNVSKTDSKEHAE